MGAGAGLVSIFLALRGADGGVGGCLERIVATDGHRLARVEAPLPDGAENMPGVIVPRKTVGELRKLLQSALWRFLANADIDIILMDIMMPRMDGYEAMEEIRKTHKRMPIIALTAKAMKGDRKKCIDAGANDYLAKPVDTDKLISMLRVWLYA